MSALALVGLAFIVIGFLSSRRARTQGTPRPLDIIISPGACVRLTSNLWQEREEKTEIVHLGTTGKIVKVRATEFAILYFIDWDNGMHSAVLPTLFEHQEILVDECKAAA